MTRARPVATKMHHLRIGVVLIAAAWTVGFPLVSSANPVDDANSGMDALNARQFSKAVELFTRAIHSKKLSASDLESAYVERGKAYLGERNTKLALADLDHALKLNPSDQEASDLRDQTQSVATVGTSPAQAQFDAAKISWQSGNCAEAEAQYQQGLTLDPYNPAADFYYGDCLAKDGNTGGALGPLRLAVQYGESVPEGQMAADDVKRLASVTSPSQGNDDGCAIPVSPSLPDGTSATAQQMQEARTRLKIFFRASDRFEECVQGVLADLQAQAQQLGNNLSSRLVQKLQGPVERNQQERQSLSDGLAASESAYRAAHRP